MEKSLDVTPATDGLRKVENSAETATTNLKFSETKSIKNHKHKYKYKTTKGNTITKQLGSDPRSLPHPKALYAHNAAD